MPVAELDDTGNLIIVRTTWNEKVLITQVPGARRAPGDAREATWSIPTSWAAAVTLRGIFGDTLELGPRLTEWAWSERRERVEPCMLLRDRIDAEGVDWVDEPRLYEFQKAGVAWMLYSGSGLLADEMGSGKSVQLSVMLRMLGEAALPALIVCPNSVKRHWMRHIEEWVPDVTPYVLDGGTAAGRKILAKATEDPRAVVITNLESVRNFSRLAPYGSINLKRCRVCDPRFGDEKLKVAQCEVHPKELNGFGFKLCVLDEAHRVKNPQAKQTRAIWSVFHDASVRYRWALTGTPITQNPSDLWSIMHAVAPHEYPVKSKWVDRYCLTAWNAFGGMDVAGLRPDTREELFRVLDPRMRRMLKKIVLKQLPPKVREPRWVEMTTTQRRGYRDLETTLATRLDDGQLLVAQNQLVALTRRMQFASANVQVEKIDPDDVSSWKVTLVEQSPKLDELEAVLEELGDRPVAVAAVHKDLLYMAAERFQKSGVRYVLFTGDQSTHERDTALQQMQRGQARVLLFSMGAGSVGVDMTFTDTMVMLQRSWSLVENVQTEDRVHRVGSERYESVQIIDLITRDTIEEQQVARILEKLKRLEEITRDRARLHAAGLDTSHLDQEENLIMNTDLAKEVM